MAFAKKRIVYEPEPTIILLGCRPMVPYHGFDPDERGNDPPFHVPQSTPERPWVVADVPWPRERCPVCKGRDRPGVHCAWCAMPEKQRRQVMRILADREARERARWRIQRQVEDQLRKTPKLHEADKREFFDAVDEFGNRVGEAWLRAIGQLPTWNDADLVVVAAAD